MQWQSAPDAIPLMAAAGVCAALGVFGFRHRRLHSATGFVGLMAVCAWWSFCYALYRASAHPETKLLLAHAAQLGATLLSVAWTVFTLQYSRLERWLAPRWVAAWAAVPVATQLLAFTNGLHGLFWRELQPVLRADGILVMQQQAGPAFRLHLYYSWTMLAVCAAILSVRIVRSVRVFRAQAVAILVAAVVPLVGNILYQSRVVTLGFNPAPYLFVVTGLVFFWAIFRLRLLDIVPVARETLVEELPDAVVVLDEEDRVLDVNPAARRLLGAPGELLGLPVAESFPVLVPVLAAAGDGSGGAGAARLRAELEVAGERRVLDARVSPLRDARGGPSGRLLVLRDMTERERHEGALSLQRAYLDQLFEASPEGIALLDAEDRVVDVNGQFTRIFGYAREEARGRAISELIVPPELQVQARAITAQVAAGQPVAVETVRRRADGSGVDVLVSGTPVFAGGRRAGTWGIYRDISRRKQDERARAELLLREQHARAEAEAATRRAAFLAEVGTLLSASFDYATVYRELARLAVPELADYCLIDEVEPDGGTRRVAVAHVDPEKEATLLMRDSRNPADGDDRARPVLRVVRSGRAEMVPDFTDAMAERLALDPAHRARFAALGLRSFLIVPLMARGRTLGAITLAYSESGRRHGAPELEVAQEMARRAALAIDNARLYGEAREAVRARDSVLGVVSHDLRNPLTAVMLNADAVLTGGTPLPEWAREALCMIVRSAEGMDRLIRDLLDVAAMEAGQLQVRREPVAPALLVGDAVDLFGPLAEERGIVLLALPPEGEVPPVLADRDRLMQVFNNLVGNALKFTPPGGMVMVGVADHAGGAVRFWVRDTGPGIPESDFARLFDRFWQGNLRRDGAGLGLPIARGIVETHGGELWVESQEGAGATFHFTLPGCGEEAVVRAG